MSDIRQTLGDLITVKGTIDDISPRRFVYDHFHIWGAHELFYGDIGEMRYVPEIGDLVVDNTTAKFSRVTSVDPASFLFTTTPVTDGYHYSDISDVVGTTDMGYERLYLDTTTTPTTATIDQSVRVSGPLISYCIVFRDAVLGPNSRSVSRVFNTDGSFNSDRVDMEKLSGGTGSTTASLSVAKPFHITDTLLDGDIVTAVFYDDLGNVIYKKRLLVEGVGQIREATQTNKMVESVYFESPSVDTSTPDTLLRDNQRTLVDMNLTVKVRYTDGSIKTLEITNTAITLIGADIFNSDMDYGSTDNLVLRYDLEVNERAIGTGGNGTFITRGYQVISLLVPASNDIVTGINIVGNIYNGTTIALTIGDPISTSDLQIAVSYQDGHVENHSITSNNIEVVDMNYLTSTSSSLPSSEMVSFTYLPKSTDTIVTNAVTVQSVSVTRST